MDQFTAIFTQLGVDSSLVPQLVIIITTFVMGHFLFMGKLQRVLENREEKTVKLESSADEIVEKVTHMQSEYKLKISEANRAALKNSTERNQKILDTYTGQYKQTEKEVGQFVDQSRNEFGKEVASNKEKYLSEAEMLAQSLVQKILQ